MKIISLLGIKNGIVTLLIMLIIINNDDSHLLKTWLARKELEKKQLSMINEYVI